MSKSEPLDLSVLQSEESASGQCLINTFGTRALSQPALGFLVIGWKEQQQSLEGFGYQSIGKHITDPAVNISTPIIEGAPSPDMSQQKRYVAEHGDRAISIQQPQMIRKVIRRDYSETSNAFEVHRCEPRF